MNTGRYVLSQIIELVERKTLSRLVAGYGAEERVRHFKCRQQFICMVFAQMTSRDGLRDIATCLNARPETLYHLGFTEKVAKSTLAEANETPDWRIRPDPARGHPQPHPHLTQCPSKRSTTGMTDWPPAGAA